MGMHTSVEVYCELPAKWEKLMAVKAACDAADISYPKEISDIFDKEIILRDKYVRIEVASKREKQRGVSHFAENGTDGFEVYLNELPPDVKLIRFVNSY
jgi:hypothetical protein